MPEGTHRCSVDGCPNLAAYEAMRYEFDDVEGAVVFELDEDCPYICVEHALENERRAGPVRRLHDVVDYPYTNLARRPGMTMYVQLEPAYAA